MTERTPKPLSETSDADKLKKGEFDIVTKVLNTLTDPEAAFDALDLVMNSNTALDSNQKFELFKAVLDRIIPNRESFESLPLSLRAAIFEFLPNAFDSEAMSLSPLEQVYWTRAFLKRIGCRNFQEYIQQSVALETVDQHLFGHSVALRNEDFTAKDLLWLETITLGQLQQIGVTDMGQLVELLRQYELDISVRDQKESE